MIKGEQKQRTPYKQYLRDEAGPSTRLFLFCETVKANNIKVEGGQNICVRKRISAEILMWR